MNNVNNKEKQTLNEKNEIWIVELNSFLKVLESLECSKVNVLCYILKNIKPTDNIFIGTYRKIVKETGISYDTVYRTLKMLQDKKYITKIQNGVYMISTKLINKCNDKKQAIILNSEE